MKEAFGSINKWTAETIKNASNILTGLKPKDLRQLPAGAVKDSVEKLKHVKFSPIQVKSKHSLSFKKKYKSFSLFDVEKRNRKESQGIIGKRK